MRRSDRQITDINEINGIIERCNVCRLAMTDGELPYIVPLCFGYEFENDTLVLYFHSAKEGKKIDLLGKNPIVCFEMDSNSGLKDGAENACNYSMYYESVIGTGQAEFITDLSAKKNALMKLMKHLTKKDGFIYDERIINMTAVFKIASKDYTAKRLGRQG